MHTHTCAYQGLHYVNVQHFCVMQFLNDSRVEGYLEPCCLIMMELFYEIVNDRKPFIYVICVYMYIYIHKCIAVS